MDTLILLLVHSQMVFSQAGFVLKKEAKAIKIFVKSWRITVLASLGDYRAIP
jgi:hypothetical protein